MNLSVPKIQDYFNSTNNSEGKTLLAKLMASFDNIEMKLSTMPDNVDVVEQSIDLLTLFKRLNCCLNMDLSSTYHKSKFFIIKKEVLDSLLCFIKLDGISHRIRVEFIEFAFKVLKDTYEGKNFDKLVNDAFIFRFLKKEELIKKSMNMRFRPYPDKAEETNYSQTNSDKDKSFDPSDDEIEQFFKENRTQFFKLMMSGEAESFKDPMADFDSKEFYHYYLTLEEQRNMMNSSQAEKTYLNVER